MTQQAERTEATPAMLDAMRQGEIDRQWLAEHPEVLEPYRGEWVVIHRGRVVAHSADAWEAGQRGNAQTYPGCLFFRVPTREEAEAVRIL